MNTCLAEIIEQVFKRKEAPVPKQNVGYATELVLLEAVKIFLVLA
jgi:hypothetical protein